MRKVVQLVLLVAVVAYVLGALSVAVFRTDSAIEEFKLGQTTFILRGWSSEEGDELKELYEESYPIITEIFGSEPVNLDGSPNVEVLVRKEGFQKEGILGRTSCFIEPTFCAITFESTEPFNATHELAHLVFGTFGFPNEIYDEGYIDAAALLVGDRLNRDYLPAFRSIHLGRWDPLIANQRELALPSRVEIDHPALTDIRRALAADAWLAVLAEDPEFLTKLRGKALATFLDRLRGGEAKLDPIQASRRLFSGNWSLIIERYPLLQEPLSKSQIIIVPNTVGLQNLEQLIAVAFVPGSSEKAIPGAVVRVQEWIDGRLAKEYVAKTNDSGFITLAKLENLLRSGGRDFRYRVETEFDSDDASFEITKEGEIIATEGAQH